MTVTAAIGLISDVGRILGRYPVGPTHVVQLIGSYFCGTLPHRDISVRLYCLANCYKVIIQNATQPYITMFHGNVIKSCHPTAEKTRTFVSAFVKGIFNYLVI